MFQHTNHHAKLALCCINLNQYREAVDAAATEANTISIRKEGQCWRVCMSRSS